MSIVTQKANALEAVTGRRARFLVTGYASLPKRLPCPPRPSRAAISPLWQRDDNENNPLAHATANNQAVRMAPQKPRPSAFRQANKWPMASALCTAPSGSRSADPMLAMIYVNSPWPTAWLLPHFGPPVRPYLSQISHLSQGVLVNVLFNPKIP